MAQFNGTLKDFEKFIGPRLRNLVQTKISKKYKVRIGKCENCQKTDSLEAAHIYGNDRKTILRKSMDGFIAEDIITNLDLIVFEKLFIEHHHPLEKSFKILCKDCHRDYDGKMSKKHKINIEKNLDMKTTEFKIWLIESKNYKKNVAQSRASNCQTVQNHHGDLDNHFKKDKGQELLELLSYSTEDESENRPVKHNVKINGNLRTGSATLKQAVKLYMNFKAKNSLDNIKKTNVLNNEYKDVEDITEEDIYWGIKDFEEERKIITGR